METKRKGGALAQVFAWLYLICLIWYLMPPSRRKLITMRLTDELRWRSQRLAAAYGRYGMNRELKGDADAAQASYSAAYHLMRAVHDRALGWYEKTRGAI